MMSRLGFTGFGWGLVFSVVKREGVGVGVGTAGDVTVGGGVGAGSSGEGGVG